MIILEHLKLSGYKSIKHLDLDFGHVNVLIGANGSGKSNLLSFLKLLKYIPGGDLQYCINRKESGANSILYYGAKRTRHIAATLDIGDAAGDKYHYSFCLEYAAGDRLIFENERFALSQKVARNEYEKFEENLGAGHSESKINYHEKPILGENRLAELLESFQAYHFNDTSWTAPIRQNTSLGNLSGKLRSGGDNLAHILYRHSLDSPSHYSLILDCIRQVMPWFREFVWEPNPQGVVKLQWRVENAADPEYVIQAHQTPDGTLRAMGLITLLLNCRETNGLSSRIIIIDEPEMGLHPSAICTIASLMHDASCHAQIILATQSPSMLDYFEPENVIVVDWSNEGSQFKRQSPTELEDWLKDYSLSELWEKNVLGGGPF